MLAVSRQSRPVTLDELIGQDHVKSVLNAAVAQGRIGHAYLFSGPRGVGKTTSARLLAMAVNCEAESGQPCGTCESCMLVQRDAHPDVTELDAASHNSVDDIRELREHVGLASLRGGRRVWILDEAHMLSRSAANALLKTLEEPPSNTLFILATTEPEKLPPTILSRCQHFRFRRLTEAEIAQKLRTIIDRAEKSADEDAIQFIAASADGAMRDAESLLERLLVTDEPITRHMVEETLGLPPAERLDALVEALFAGNLSTVLESVSELYWEGFAPRTLAEQFSRSLRTALHAALAGTKPYADRLDAVLGVLERADEELDRFVRHNDLYALELYMVTLHNHLHLAAPAPVAVVQEAQEAQQVPTPTPAPTPVATRVTTPVATPVAKPTPSPTPVTEPIAKAASEETDVYGDVLSKVTDGVLKAFLAPATIAKTGNAVTIRYADSFAFHHGKLKSREADMSALVQEIFGADATVQIALGNAPPKAAAAPRSPEPTPRPPVTPSPVEEAKEPDTRDFDDDMPIPTDPFADAPVVATEQTQNSATAQQPAVKSEGEAMETVAAETLAEMQELFPGTILRYSWERQPEVPGKEDLDGEEPPFEETE